MDRREENAKIKASFEKVFNNPDGKRVLKYLKKSLAVEYYMNDEEISSELSLVREGMRRAYLIIIKQIKEEER